MPSTLHLTLPWHLRRSRKTLSLDVLGTNERTLAVIIKQLHRPGSYTLQTHHLTLDEPLPTAAISIASSLPTAIAISRPLANNRALLIEEES